jgi:hypothetical protein
MSTPITGFTLYDAVHARLDDHLVTATARATKVYVGIIPPGAIPDDTATKPVVCIRARTERSQDGFKFDAVNFIMQVMAIVPLSAGSNELELVMQGVYGDATPGSQTAPLYGLHRWVPTVSGFSCSHMTRESFDVSFDADFITAIDEYRCEVRRA